MLARYSSAELFIRRPPRDTDGPGRGEEEEMTKEDAVAEAIHSEYSASGITNELDRKQARRAIEAADKWDAENKGLEEEARELGRAMYDVRVSMGPPEIEAFEWWMKREDVFKPLLAVARKARELYGAKGK